MFQPVDGFNVHPNDKDYILKHNPRLYTSNINGDIATKNRDKEKFLLQLGLLPQPYLGNIEKSTIIMLMLNPGFSGGEFKEHNEPGSQQAILNTIHQNFRNNGISEYPFMYINPKFNNTEGWKYLCGKKGYGLKKGRLRDCLDRFRDISHKTDQEVLRFFSQHISFLETVPYHSAGFNLTNKFIRELPSFKMAMDYLNYKAEDQNNLIFIIRGLRFLDSELVKKKNVIVFDKSEGRGAWFSCSESLNNSKHGDILINHLLNLNRS